MKSDKYSERKTQLLKKHIITYIRQYSPETANSIEAYDLINNFDFNDSLRIKKEYAYNAWVELKRNTPESNLADNLYQVVNYQGKLLEFLKHKISQLESISNIAEDYERLSEAYDLICKDIFASLQNSHTENRKFRIAMFTPLPPLQNGIADYSVKIICELSQYFEIDVYIDANYIPDSNVISSQNNIYVHTEFSKRHENYDAIIYKIGNNPDHTYMVPYALQYPGIIVLHDFKLGYLRSFLSKKMQNYCDQNCEVNSTFNMEDQENPFNLYLLKPAKGVIVHSIYSALGILEQDFSKRIFVISHFAELEISSPEPLKLRQKYQLEDEIVFASFGFVTVTKRITCALMAFSQIVKKYPQKKFHYFIVGKADADQETEINKVIKENHLEKMVTLTGYTELKTFEEYVEIADICINLRYPYGGETSGTLSRILGKGKPCIVTDIGAFSELPDSCCIKIPYNSKSEINDICDAIEKLLNNMELRIQMGKNGVSYVHNHLSLHNIGEEYKKAILSILHNEPNITYLKLKKTAGFIACNYFSNESKCVQWLTEELIKEL